MSRSSSTAPAAPSWADWGKLAALCTVLSALLSVGMTLGTQSSALAQKVDRIEFTSHVAAADRRFQADSIERAYQAAAWSRIESKLDSTNTRLSRLICERGPSYCR